MDEKGTASRQTPRSGICFGTEDFDATLGGDCGEACGGTVIFVHLRLTKILSHGKRNIKKFAFKIKL